ncbi:MAG: bifunctional riboflavin kinase/FAD synthetase [Bryobacteraceae bacterium]
MRVARTLEEAAEFGPTAVTIGNFDGVHIGHRRLMEEAAAAGHAMNAVAGVLTFDPHPATIVAPQRAGRLLSTQAERCSIMAREGMDFVLILPFTKLISTWTPERFVEKVLVESLHAKLVVVGENFHFGHNQAGNTKVLGELGKKFGFETRVIPPVRHRGVTVSSSSIRKLVEAGNVSRAARLLARPYVLQGEVVKGRGVGSTQTVPTLNLNAGEATLPATGVYITRTTDMMEENRRWKSITNVGFRPTFADGTGSELSVETFLLDPFEPPTPTHIRVEFLRRVREERKFESPEALKAQILKDVSRALKFFERVKTAAPAAFQ